MKEAVPPSQEVHSGSEELTPRDVIDIYYQTLSDTANDADDSRGKAKAKEVMRLLDTIRKTSAVMRKDDGVPYEERRRLIRESDDFSKVKALYLKLGIAEMLTLGDWSVNRKDEIPKSMGVVSFPDIETQLLHFYDENKLLAHSSKDGSNKLIHLDLGCGNGVMCDNLRSNESNPFGDEKLLSDDCWAEVGYADRIYFTLNDLLHTFVKNEYKENAGLLEFINLISTLLTRKIYFSKKHRKELSGDERKLKNERTLRDLASNPNLIRKILPHLDRYIKNLSKFAREGKKVRADTEFPLDSERDVPRDLIEEYLKAPASFLDKYFEPKAWKRNLQMEEKIKSLDDEIKSIDKELEKLARQLADPDTSPSSRSEIISKRQNHYRKRKRLADERAGIAGGTEDLSGDITIYPHNVILGGFEKFAERFPEAPAFNFVHSFRASSHAEDPLYKDLNTQVAKRLKPGGIIIEDGKRESYTRYERINELMALQNELGPEYRVGVIADKEGAKSVLVQRAIICSDGTNKFFADEYGDRILCEGCFYVPIQDFSSEWPEVIFRNEIIKRLKELFINSILEDLEPGERYKAVFDGRMEFRSIHGGDRLNSILRQQKVFTGREWQAIKAMSSDSPVYGMFVDKVLRDVVAKEIEKVRQRVDAVTYGATLLKPDSKVQTFPIPNRSSVINTTRCFETASLPRNLDVPDLNDPSLERERIELAAKLKKLEELTGKPPIKVLEFDNCFTNPLMVSTLCGLLGMEDSFDQSVLAENGLIEIENVKLKSMKYPAQQDGIYIIGGSLNDVYDKYGEAFTDQFSQELLKRAEAGEPVRGLGICFGSQSLLQAFGNLRGRNFKTVKGALQFGAFPTRFSNSSQYPALKHLARKNCTTVMTRSGYSLVSGYENMGEEEIEPLAFEGALEGGGWKKNRSVPPVAFSLLNGAIITSQFHPEVRLADESHLHALRKHSKRYHNQIYCRFGSPAHIKKSDNRIVVPRSALSSQDAIYNRNVHIPALDKAGRRTTWVEKDIGMAWLIPILNSHADSLLKQLGKQH
jgi:hypothetical protein